MANKEEQAGLQDRFFIKYGAHELTSLSSKYEDLAKEILKNGGSVLDDSMTHLENSYHKAIAKLVDHMFSKQQRDKFNIWFVHQEELQHITTLPPGIYVCVPDDFVAGERLSVAVNNLLQPSCERMPDMYTMKAAVTKLSTDRRINHLQIVGDTVVLRGQHIVTDVDFCDNINDAIALEKLLWNYASSESKSVAAELLASQPLSEDIQAYWRERFKSMDFKEACNMLIKIRKALYITGEK